MSAAVIRISKTNSAKVKLEQTKKILRNELKYNININIRKWLARTAFKLPLFNLTLKGTFPF